MTPGRGTRLKYKEKHGKIVAAKEHMEKPSKHAFLLAILIMALVLCSCKGSAKEEPVADYESMQEAVLAHKAGTDITGKTIKVKMEQNSAAGVIYSNPDLKANANLYATIITKDENRDEVLGLKKGDTVVIKVDSVDDHLKYSIYVYAVEYQIYR